MKMNSKMKLAVIVTILSAAVIARGETETVDGYTWTYRIVDGNAEIYNDGNCAVSPKPDGDVAIPPMLGGKLVTSIGSAAFYDCRNLKSVSFPDAVTNIGYLAFCDCSSLTNITIPAGVTAINSQTFARCESLAEVTIPESVTNIGYYAFEGCNSLTNIAISSSVSEIDSTAFDRCNNLTDITVPDDNQYYSNRNSLLCDKAGTTIVMSPKGLKSVTIPEGVTNIGDSAFYGCATLTDISIPESVEAIGRYAFYDCDGLASDGFIIVRGILFEYIGDETDITIPSSVAEIGVSAFSYNKVATNVTIPGSVTIVEDEAFRDCTGLENMVIPGSVETIGWGAFYGCSSLTNVTISSGVKSIGEAAFCDCGTLTKGDIPDSVTDIGRGAFRGCDSLVAFTVSSDNQNFCVSNGLLCNKDVTKVIACPASMTNVMIPDSVQEIGDEAFAGVMLSEITMPEGLSSIGWSAFNGCDALTSIEIPEGVTYISMYCFAGCENLSSVSLPVSVMSIGAEAFYGCALREIAIPRNVQNIEWSAFANCINLDSASLPNTLDGTLDDSIFEGCSPDLEISYYEVNVPTATAFTYTISDSGEATITGASNITAILEIPALIDGHPVTSLAPWSIYTCFDLRSVTIPNTVTNIGEGVFSHCRSLEDIFVEDGNGAYKVVDGLLLSKDGTLLALVPGALGKLVVPESVRTIGRSACEGSSLTNVVFSTLVENIEEAAFWACDIESIEIPDSVSSIGVGAFSSCHLLDSIYVGSGNSSYKTDGGLLLTKDGKCLVAVPGARSGVTVPEGVTNICESAFSTCNYLTNVILPDSLIDIDAYAFECCWNITHIEIPSSVTFIGTNAFSYCSSLTNIVFNGDAPEMEGGVFEGLPEGCVAYVSQQSSGWNVEIPGMWNGVRIEYFDESHPPQLTYTYSVSDSGEATITGANMIPSVLEIPAAIDGHPVVAIGSKAFQGWVQVKEVVIPDSIKSIGAYAFQYCDGIERIVWGAGITDISQWAFSYCKKLSDVTFKYGLKTIAQYAFGYCEALETVTLPRSVEDIKWGAFASDPALETAYFHSNFRGKGSSGMFENSPNVAVYYYNCLTPGVPPPVENLSATTNGPRVIRVAWDLDSGVEVSAFKVYRASTDVFADAGLLAEVDSSEDVSGYEYDDYDVEEDTDYYYWVIPQNDIFEGEVSDFVVGSSFGPLEIDVSDMFYGVELVDFEQMLSVSDDRGSDNLEWMVDDYSILPPGIEMSWNGVLSGVPIQHGTYTFTVRCQDWCFGVETTAEITVDISENDNRKPVVSESSPADVTDVVLTEGTTQLFSVSASDPDGQNIRYVWMVDGEEVLSGAKARTLLFDPSDYDDDPWGHEVICYVNDDLWENIVCRKWMVYMPQTFYVDAANGSDDNDGLTSATAFASIFMALEWASPYSTIYVAPGICYGDVYTWRPVTVEAVGGVATIENGIFYGGSKEYDGSLIVRGFIVKNAYGAARNVDLERCIITGCGEMDGYYGGEIEFSGILQDCTLNRCTIAGNMATPEHPLMVDCSYDESTIVWGNNDENDELVDPVFVSLSNGDCRLRNSSPYVTNGIATRGALDDVVSGHVISASVVGPGSLDKMVAAVEDGESVTFSVAVGSHPIDHFEVNGEPVVASGNSYTFFNVSADAALTAFFVPNITFYVDATNGNDAADGFTSVSAVASLQTAIDRAVNGDMILVADGVYAPIETRNRRIVIESENGYRNAIIDGGHETNCALLGGPESFVEGEPVGYGELWQGTNTVLRGFTLRNGYAVWGAGVTAGTVENCLIVNNIVEAFPWNSDSPNGLGGGAFLSVLRNCTIVGNTSSPAISDEDEVLGGIDGGSCACTLFNCIEWGNADDVEGDEVVGIDWWKASIYENCCRDNPLFADAANGDYRLRPESPAVVCGAVVAGCELEIAPSKIPELTETEATQWVSSTLAMRYAKEGEGVEGYRSRFEAKFGSDPVAAMSMPTDKKDAQGNNMYVWQDYVAGTDPTDTNSVFTATITMVDGAPVVEWSPKLGAAEESRRRYTIYGKAGLESGEEWHSPTNALDRFFTVGVEMK